MAFKRPVAGDPVLVEDFGQPVYDLLTAMAYQQATTFVPVIRNGTSSVAYTLGESLWTQIGKQVWFMGRASITGTGVVGNIDISLPTACYSDVNQIVGTIYLYDASASSNVIGHAVTTSATIKLLQTVGYAQTALGAGDFLTWNVSYRSAA